MCLVMFDWQPVNEVNFQALNLKLKLLTYRRVPSSVPYILRGLMELGDTVQQDQYLSVRPYK